MMLLKKAERKLGEEKGKAADKIEVAKNLLKSGVFIEIIVESTGLTIYEVKQFIKD
jgi:predicted transposase/invertase (TIGR01784 family)